MLRLIALALFLASLAACSHLPNFSLGSPSPAEQEKTARQKAKQDLASGIGYYQDGNYIAAQRAIQGALNHGLTDKQDKVDARKYLAFIACLNQRQAECKNQFRAAFEVDPKFTLSPAEIGHPLWGPVFKSVREEQARKAK